MFAIDWWDRVDVWSAVYAATTVLVALALYARALHNRRRI